MRLKKPYVASMDQVRITKEGDAAIIEYAEPGVWVTHYTLGPQVQKMTEEEILEVWNEGLRATEAFRASYKYVAKEIPPGSPQLERSDFSGELLPRGDVLRGYIERGGPDCETTIQIDDQEFSMEEFGKLLQPYAGWGMRLVFVPDDELHVKPRIRVKEPKPPKSGPAKTRRKAEPPQAR